MKYFAPTARIRRTPFTEGVEAAGVSVYTSYNHMLLPAAFAGLVEDYRHLKRAVQIWDVACERQVEVAGPDAARLMQMLTPRDLSRATPGRCLYVPVTDERGRMLNDPVALKLAEDRWWISIADSDLLYWVKGVAFGLGLEVEVSEPDVSPLAVQGPRADALMARVFGEEVTQLRFFRYGWFEFEGHPLVIARSGYSKQGGFEIYVTPGDIGMDLWRALMEAGDDLEVRAGGPNLIERIEGGLLSYGADMTLANTPHECGLGQYCDGAHLPGVIGGAAILAEAERGPARQIRAIEIACSALPPLEAPWPLMDGGQRVGQVTSAAFSPDHGVGVAIGMVERTHWAPGTELVVETHGPALPATVRASFWS
ncbi:dimethylsulfoniopropionate demethylase [Meinhardsimonia xiamenensis]|nr:dimethylsulfoniopropionate demethylase [Meinhardsimonia xiamenensis]